MRLVNCAKINIRWFSTRNIMHFMSLIWDRLDFNLRWLDGLVPPLNLRLKVGPFSKARFFRAVGEDFLKLIIKLAGLRPDANVLDVGCGCGQLAIALTKYLKQGIYEGFDINDELIDWCKKNISSKYPNFHFELIDLYHQHYNPHGKYKASKLKFAYSNDSFDSVILGSVFTHMLPADICNYFSEISRVLRKGGKCIVTYFLLNTASIQSIHKGISSIDFKYVYKYYRTRNEERPESAVAYEENYIRGLYKKHGLRISEPAAYGKWHLGRFKFCGVSWPLYLKNDFGNYQDTIVAVKD